VKQRLGPGAGVLVRLVVGGVWIVAGAAKLLDPAQSVAAVRAYQLLPGSTAQPVGQLLPVVEVVVGACLVLGLLTRWVSVVSALLFVAFIVGIASVWTRGITIDCGCFGGGGYDPNAASAYPWEIARDAALLLVSLGLVRWPRTPWSVDEPLFRRTPARTA
jgi:uncharacterized membrane protein YphA (DoxX/SURF4 family)